MCDEELFIGPPVFEIWVLRLLCVVALRFRNTPELEDAIQETFLVVLQCKERFTAEGIENPRGYIYRILLREIGRQRRAKLRWGLPSELLPNSPDRRATPYETAALRDELRRLKPELCKLSDPERAVLGMRLAGKSYKEIGESLEMSESTARSHMYRALQRLCCEDEPKP